METHSSCEMYANVDTNTLAEYWRNRTDHPELDHPFPYNETTSKFHMVIPV